MNNSKFYFPMVLHRDTSVGSLVVPWVTQLPLVQDVVNSVYVLMDDEGIGQGVYTWDGSRFRFTLPYEDICSAVIGGATVDIYYDITTVSPIPQRALVWRNGLPYSDPNFTANDGAVWAVLLYPLSAAGDIKSVNGQFPDQNGNVVVKAIDNNSTTGSSLIVDNGALTGNISLKTLVAGSGISLSDDPNGNLKIDGVSQYVLPAATDTTLGGVKIGSGVNVTSDGTISVPAAPVQSVSGQVGDVVVHVTDNNANTGTTLIVDSGATTANAKLKTLVPGNLITFANDANGNLVINSTATSGALTAVNSEGTGTSLVDNNGTTGGIATIKSLAAGSNVTITAAGDGKTLTIAANQVINPATTTSIGGVIIGAGLNVDGTGNISLAPPVGVSLGGVKAGSGITIDSDGTINALGAVVSVSGQTGAVVVKTTDNNPATGTSLIVDTGETTANAKLKTLVPGNLISFENDANGNLVINSTSTSGGITAVNSEGTGTSLVDNDGTSGGIATIKSIAAGSNVTITPSGDGKTLTVAANQVLNPATTTTIGGVIVGNGLNVDGTGKVSLAPPTGVNLGGVKAGTGISIAADGTISSTATGAVSSVSGQTGDVVVKATDNNSATGTSLISDSGATTANIKLKTLVAGSGVTITPDANGNLSIASTATGGVSSITYGTSDPLTGAITVTAGPSISISNTGNTVQISGTGVPEAPNDGNGYMRQNLGWSVVPSIANAITSITGQTGTGAVILVESNPPANSAIIKSLVAGQNVSLTEADGLITITASIPAGTVSTVNGISPNGSGNVTLTAANVNAVPVAGNVTMTGPLNFGSQVVNGIPTPQNPSDAVPLSFLQNLTIDGGVIG